MHIYMCVYVSFEWWWWSLSLSSCLYMHLLIFIFCSLTYTHFLCVFHWVCVSLQCSICNLLSLTTKLPSFFLFHIFHICMNLWIYHTHTYHIYVSLSLSFTKYTRKHNSKSVYVIGHAHGYTTEPPILFSNNISLSFSISLPHSLSLSLSPIISITIVLLYILVEAIDMQCVSRPHSIHRCSFSFSFSLSDTSAIQLILNTICYCKHYFVILPVQIHTHIRETYANNITHNIIVIIDTLLK